MRSINSVATILCVMLAAGLTAFAQTNLTALDGARVNIEGQTGKVVVLAIGASWLPLSAKQAEFTNSLAKKYAGKNVVVYFVATDSVNTRSKNFASDERIRSFAFENKLTVPVLRDSEGTMTLRKFNVEQVPSFVILDKSGVQSGEPFGGIDPKYDVTIQIAKLIDRLL